MDPEQQSSPTKHNEFLRCGPAILRRILLRLSGPSLRIVATQLARAAIAHRCFLAIVEAVADVYLQQRYNTIRQNNECARGDLVDVLCEDPHENVSKLQQLWCLAPALPLRFVLLPGFIIRDLRKTGHLAPLNLPTKISDGHIRGMSNTPQCRYECIRTGGRIKMADGNNWITIVLDA